MITVILISLTKNVQQVVRGVTVWEEKGVKVVNPLVQICNKEQAESEAEYVGYE